MRFHNIAYKNIKGNLNKYVMYYLSNLIVVMVFFIFSNFLYNPALNDISKLGTMGALTSRVMYLCEGVILVFTLFFTTYSITNFLKSREKEFGLLSMFGITKSQLRGYVMLENFIVALTSIVTGLLLGILFSKLFIMAVVAIMDLNTPIVFFNIL
jgi:putative ABC transport system permease protein